MLPVLDLDPAPEPAAAIELSRCLETNPSSPIRQAWRNRSGPISPCSNGARWMPSTRRASSRAGWSCASDSGSLPEILAVADQHVEGVELDLGIVLAAMQPVEVGDAVDTEQHGLAVDHERCIPIAQRGLGDQRISAAPVVAVPGEQPHALAVALNDQPIAVMLDFVDPFRPVGDFRRLGRNAGFKRA